MWWCAKNKHSMLQLSMFFQHTNEKLALHPEHKVSFLLTFTNQEEGLLWLESRVGMNQKSKQTKSNDF